MTEHRLGGQWTDRKLGCVREYAAAWLKIMDHETRKWGWRTRYLDVFSGSGSYAPRIASDGDQQPNLFSTEETEEEYTELRKGSARIAIEMEPKFHRIDLVEKNPAFAKQLEDLAIANDAPHVTVHRADANEAVPRLARSIVKSERALAFLDPYGCELSWAALSELAATQRADVWYLFPTMGINRQLKQNPDSIPQSVKARLTAVLGTDEWESTFYSLEPKTDLFGEIEVTTRKAGPNEVETFFIQRLSSIFSYVHEDCLRLKNRRNGHMFSLAFAVGNPSTSAITAAKRLARSAIQKWEAK